MVPGRHRRSSAATIPVALILLAGCEGLLSEPAGTEVRPDALEVTAEPEILAEGEWAELRVTALDADGRTLPRLPPWFVPSLRSLDPDIVELDGERARAVGPGVARVRAALSGVEGDGLVGVNPESVDVRVDAAYLNQSAQRYDGSVPLAAGRDAYLRVFLESDRPNAFLPEVRIHFHHDGQPVATLTAVPERPGIPQAGTLAEEEWEGSWNVRVDGELVRPGMGLSIEVDPEGRMPAVDRGALLHPADGGLLEPDVRELPPFRLVVVPVHQEDPALRPEPSEAELEELVTPAVGMLPVVDPEVELREPMSTGGRAGAFQGWIEILQDVHALQMLDPRPGYYYGLVRPVASQGIGGVALVGLPAAAGSEELPEAARTLAHELGHNMSLLHAHCGPVHPSTVDWDNPWRAGEIGIVGLDVEEGELIRPDARDVMGYCSLGWISDYNYERALSFRAEHEAGIMANSSGASATPGEVLLVRGRVEPDGGLVLRPAFRIDGAKASGLEGGDYRVEAVDRDGGVLRSWSFEPRAVSHADVRSFVLALPLDDVPEGEIAALRVEGATLSAVLESTVGAGSRSPFRTAGEGATIPDFPGTRVDDPPVSARRGADGAVMLRWDRREHSEVLVRDPATGHILGFGRQGRLEVVSGSERLEVSVSHGPDSQRHEIQVEREH